MRNFGGHALEARRTSVVHKRPSLAGRGVRRAPRATPQGDGLGHDRSLLDSSIQTLR